MVRGAVAWCLLVAAGAAVWLAIALTPVQEARHHPGTLPQERVVSNYVLVSDSRIVGTEFVPSPTEAVLEENARVAWTNLYEAVLSYGATLHRPDKIPEPTGPMSEQARSNAWRVVRRRQTEANQAFADYIEKQVELGKAKPPELPGLPDSLQEKDSD